MGIELKLIYNVLREAGQFAPLFVLVVLLILRKNDLRHLGGGITRLEKGQTQLIKDFKEHLKWHMDNPPNA